MKRWNDQQDVNEKKWRYCLLAYESFTFEIQLRGSRCGFAGKERRFLDTCCSKLIYCSSIHGYMPTLQT